MSSKPPPCFVCDPGETPVAGLRLACAKHVAEASLADGRRLSDLLNQITAPKTRTMLPYVLNPVTIGTTRCWWHWLFDAPQVSPEERASNSYFEFLAQHREDYRASLDHARQVLAAAPDWRTAPNPMFEFVQRTKFDPEQMLRLSEAWWRCEVGRKRPAAIAVSEIESLSDLLLATRLPPTEVPHAVRAIGELALR